MIMQLGVILNTLVCAHPVDMGTQWVLYNPTVVYIYDSSRVCIYKTLAYHNMMFYLYSNLRS